MLPPKNTPDLLDRLDEKTENVIENKAIETQGATSFDDIMQEIKESEEWKAEVKNFEQALSPEKLDEVTQELNKANKELETKSFELAEALNNGGSYEEFQKGMKELYEDWKDITPDGIENVITDALNKNFGNVLNNLESKSIEKLQDVDGNAPPRETPSVDKEDNTLQRK